MSLTIPEVVERVKAIRDERYDAEAAHSDEDSLYEDVLRAIADGSRDAEALAAQALITKDFDFERWCS
jgi:hypothetical protein